MLLPLLWRTRLQRYLSFWDVIRACLFGRDSLAFKQQAWCIFGLGNRRDVIFGVLKQKICNCEVILLQAMVWALSNFIISAHIFFFRRAHNRHSAVRTPFFFKKHRLGFKFVACDDRLNEDVGVFIFNICGGCCSFWLLALKLINLVNMIHQCR